MDEILWNLFLLGIISAFLLRSKLDANPTWITDLNFLAPRLSGLTPNGLSNIETAEYSVNSIINFGKLQVLRAS